MEKTKQGGKKELGAPPRQEWKKEGGSPKKMTLPGKDGMKKRNGSSRGGGGTLGRTSGNGGMRRRTLEIGLKMRAPAGATLETGTEAAPAGATLETGTEAAPAGATLETGKEAAPAAGATLETGQEAAPAAGATLEIGAAEANPISPHWFGKKRSWARSRRKRHLPALAQHPWQRERSWGLSWWTSTTLWKSMMSSQKRTSRQSGHS